MWRRLASSGAGRSRYCRSRLPPRRNRRHDTLAPSVMEASRSGGDRSRPFSIDDGVVVVEDAEREIVLAQVFPDVLGRVQLGRIGRQADGSDVLWQLELIGGVPAGAVEDERGMGAGGDAAADLLEMQVHRLGVGIGHHQGGAGGPLGADGGEDVGPFVAAVARAWRARAEAGPDTGQRALLADPGLVLEPDLQRLAAGRRRLHDLGE